MNGMTLLMGLLVLSYVGSSLVTRRAAHRGGLPSGVEIAALGFLVGPHGLRLVTNEDLATFVPVAHVALGWLAFTAGIDFGFGATGRVKPSRLFFGTMSGVATAAAVTVAVWLALDFVHVPIAQPERFLLALSVGAICSASAPPAASWAGDGPTTRPSLAAALDDIALSEGWVPFGVLALVFALAPSHDLPLSRGRLQGLPSVLGRLQELTLHANACIWFLVTLGLGLLIGIAAAFLLRGKMPVENRWAVLLGAALLAVGTSARLELSAVSACFAMGQAISLLARHGDELRPMVRSTAQPVLLPALLLAGMRINLQPSAAWALVALAVALSRMCAKTVIGWVFAAVSPTLRTGGLLLGLSYSSSNALSIGLGLALALRFPGVIGDTALAIAAVYAAFGDLAAPMALRHALKAAHPVGATASIEPAPT